MEAFRGLGRLLEDGKVRAIGGSNFKPAHLQRVIEETGLVPDVNQIEDSTRTRSGKGRAPTTPTTGSSRSRGRRSDTGASCCASR